MKYTLPSSALTIGLALLINLGSSNAARGQQPPLGKNQAVQVQTSGPVHEGFAQPNENQVEPGPLLKKQPPPPIPEEMPAEQPQGANTQWIDGYWAWDAERSDYTWITGTMRNTPPGMRFVPGYWQQTDGGWRWVAGFYAPDGQVNMPYVPEPPPSLENGPTLPPPSDNSVYIPGYWNYNQGNYQWSPGFYTQARPGLVWNQPRYQWTPNGIVFLNGYWDYPLNNRGLLFAPLTFSQPLWNDPGWAYQPDYAVLYGSLLNSLFVQPGQNRYYFGNYYSPAYARAGYQPWSSYGPNRYDPLFNYYRWQNRGNPQWAANLKQNYQGVVAGTLPAPPRTLAQQAAMLSKSGNGGMRVVSPLSQLANQNIALQKTTASQKSSLQFAAQQQQQFAAIRRQQELNRAVTFQNSPQNVAKALNLAMHPPKTGGNGNNGGQVKNFTGGVALNTLPKTQIQQAQFHNNNVNAAALKTHVNTAHYAPVHNPQPVHRPAVHQATVHHAPPVHHAAAHGGHGNGHHK